VPGFVTIDEVRPVAFLQADRCADDRYPALAGTWAVGCVGSDAVNVAVSLQDGRVVTLTAPVRSPALGIGWLWTTGLPAGAWALPDSVRRTYGVTSGEGAVTTLIPRAGVATPAVANVEGHPTAFIPYADHVDRIDLTASSWPVHPAHPAPGEPVALGDAWAAWTERSPRTGADVWALRGDVVAAIAQGAGDQRLVAGSNNYLWWVDGDAVVRREMSSGAQARFPAQTGFTAGLAVDPADGSVACWEDRRALETTGVDLWCSNGAHLDRPGDQRWPTMSNGYLLWREGEQVLTARLR
jgi:hypothetical protein